MCAACRSLLFVILYTLISGGPFVWVAMMSLRTTAEIARDHYALPSPWHWEKFVDAWTKSNYSTYFWNSTVVVVIAVAAVTTIGAMAAHCLARYDFRGGRLIRFIILSGLVLPPQLLILSLFQILLEMKLYNTLTGLILVYIATHIATTVYILEGFFAQMPQDLYDAARIDGYSDFEIFWRITAPIGTACDLHRRHAELYLALERVPVRGRAADRRQQAHASARHHALHGKSSRSMSVWSRPG